MSERESSMNDVRARQWGGSGVWHPTRREDPVTYPLRARYGTTRFLLLDDDQMKLEDPIDLVTGSPYNRNDGRYGWEMHLALRYDEWERLEPRDHTLPLREQDRDPCGASDGACDGSCS